MMITVHFHPWRICITILAFILVGENTSVTGQHIDYTDSEAPNYGPWKIKVDPFIYSKPFNSSKVFLFPWLPSERNGDWFYNKGYCRKYGAEMVTLHSTDENEFFQKFMRQAGMVHPGVWLGAKIINGMDISKWENGEQFDFVIKEPWGYNEHPVSCLLAGWWDPSKYWWGDFWCTGHDITTRFFIACQKNLIQYDEESKYSNFIEQRIIPSDSK